MTVEYTILDSVKGCYLVIRRLTGVGGAVMGRRRWEVAPCPGALAEMDKSRESAPAQVVNTVSVRTKPCNLQEIGMMTTYWRTKDDTQIITEM